MLKLFAAAAATLVFGAFGTALTAELYGNQNSPAAAETSSWEARDQIVSDVIDGNLSLLQAAAAFRDLNHQSPALDEILVESYPGYTEGERACQQVLAYVRAELEGRVRDAKAQKSSKASVDPSTAVLARLQAELAAVKGKDGSVRLPGEAS